MAVPNEPNVLPFTPPLHWDFTNFAGIQTSFYPSINYSQPVEWFIPGPIEGDKFLVLSTGDMGPGSDGKIPHAIACQELFLPAGTRITGSYFFGTCDYRPFTDTGTIELIPVIDPNNPPPKPLTKISLASCSVEIVGDYGSTEDWQFFNYAISPDQEGLYDLIMTVKDGGADTIYESYLAVDDLLICGPGVLIGDLNNDCFIDLFDLSLFSREWLCLCEEHPWDPNDPNTINIDPNTLPGYSFTEYYLSNDPNIPDPNTPVDPNSLCIYADFNRNYIVEPNDLNMFMNNWLKSDY